MSTWNHKGFEITLQGAAFAVQLPKKRVAASSLASAKKAIDKHLEAQAKVVEISLPVVFYRYPYLGFRGGGRSKGKVERGIITGVDTESFKILGLPEDNETKIEYVLPASDANAALIANFIAAGLAYEDLKEKVDNRCFPRFFNSYGKNKPMYADVVKHLQDGYAAAAKVKA